MSGLPSLIATGNNESKRELLPSGSYVARCISIVEIGTLTEEFQGEKKTNKKVVVIWELPTELKEFKEGEGEKPYVRSKTFTLSIAEKATLRKFLKDWRGKDFSEDELKGFDIVKLLGVPCMMTIIHIEKKDGTSIETVSGVSPMPKGFVCPEQINISKVFTWGNYDAAIFDSLPKYLKEMMAKTPEYAAQHSPAKVAAEKNEAAETDLPWEKEEA